MPTRSAAAAVPPGAVPQSAMPQDAVPQGPMPRATVNPAPNPAPRVGQDHARYISQLQRIHGLRDQLGLEPQHYRRLLQQITGATSSKFMTFAERERVITFLSLYQELNDVSEKAQDALLHLNQSLAQSVPQEAMQKKVVLAGKTLTRTHAPIESIIAMMRDYCGPQVRLVGAGEEHKGNETVLKLEFAA